MQYKFKDDDLATIAMIIDEPGFEAIEKAFNFYLSVCGNVSQITGDPFNDGAIKGKADMLKELLFFLDDTKKEARKINEK